MVAGFIAVTALLVILCLGFSGLAIWGAWLVWGRATQAMRYDLDAAGQALRMQQTIDNAVRQRISVMRFMVDKEGNLIDAEGKAAMGAAGRLLQQPSAPNVRESSVVDDVHELERESQRVTGEADFEKRDNFAGHNMANTQPPPPVEP